MAAGLLRVGMTPDRMTIAGCLGVLVGALFLFPRGSFLAGSIVVALFVASDGLDGTMARMSGTASPWGAFLDSTLDRLSDMAVFAGIALYFAGQGETAGVAAALAAMVCSVLVSYSRARAEGLGMKADVGFAERTERTLAVLLGTFLVGFGVTPTALVVILGLVAAASAYTVGERVVYVRRQALDGMAAQAAAASTPEPVSTTRAPEAPAAAAAATAVFATPAPAAPEPAAAPVAPESTDHDGAFGDLGSDTFGQALLALGGGFDDEPEPEPRSAAPAAAPVAAPEHDDDDVEASFGAALMSMSAPHLGDEDLAPDATETTVLPTTQAARRGLQAPSDPSFPPLPEALRAFREPTDGTN